jgi:hopanoid biosynthesis associated radical SAM protein HpnH
MTRERLVITGHRKHDQRDAERTSPNLERKRKPIHPQIDRIINGLVEQRYFVYCCTNALLLERMIPKVPPSKYFCWVIHLDGMEQKHDESVARTGVFQKAVQGIETALDRGYRVCTNTTVFKNSDVADLHQMFRYVSDLGVEGSMISPGYDFKDAPDPDLFLSRQESRAIFKELLSPSNMEGTRFYNNPLYLNFLRGQREYQCSAWSNPTYTVMGWRKPCYPLADEHVQRVEELYEPELWEERYGVGRDPRCANCMMHCGFESATIFQAVATPRDWITLIKSGAAHKGGITAA